MRASELYKDDFAAEREAIARQDAIEKERQRALRRQAADRRWLDRQTKRAQALAQQHHVDEQEGWRLLRQEEELDRALDWFSQRLEVHQAAALEAEAAVIGANPWLASGNQAGSDIKEVKASPIALSQAASAPVAAGRFVGLASTFGVVDATGDVVERGAFVRTIAAAKARGKPFLYPVLYQHDVQKVIGGVATATERPDGLWVECVLDRETRDGAEAYSLVSNGMLDGLSIGYITKNAVHRADARHLTDIELLEISLVTFPAAQGARVAHTGR